jgi:hypothetical protein
MFALGGHGLLAGGGSSLRREDVGVVSIQQENAPVETLPVAVGRTPSPVEQFDQSLRDVWIDKNKVELVLRMTTNAEDESMTTARAFARTVFDTRRLREWKRLVEERHWKSISFCHRRAETGIGLINFPIEMLNDELPGQRIQQLAAEETQDINRVPVISEEEEAGMWSGLLEPCRSHTNRLELRGELTIVQARVLATVFGRPIAAAATTVSTAATSRTMKARPPCRLRVLCLSAIDITPDTASILGEVIHGSAISLCLKELSLSKCSVEPNVWPFLLGVVSPDDSEGSDLEENDVDTMKMSHHDLHDQNDSEGSMSITCEAKDDSKQSGHDSATLPSSSQPLSLSPPSVLPCLHALFLSDCDLTNLDVEAIIRALRGYPMLRTLYLNGQQNFEPSRVDSLFVSHLQKYAGIEQIQLPSRNQHSPEIQLFAELNRCGRRLLCSRRNLAHDLGSPAPVSIWPFVLERVQRLPGLSPSRRANALYYFVKELHGISTTGGSGTTRPPRKSTSSLIVADDQSIAHKSILTASTTSALSSFGGSDTSNHCED